MTHTYRLTHIRVLTWKISAQAKYTFFAQTQGPATLGARPCARYGITIAFCSLANSVVVGHTKNNADANLARFEKCKESEETLILYLFILFIFFFLFCLIFLTQNWSSPHFYSSGFTPGTISPSGHSVFTLLVLGTWPDITRPTNPL